MQSLISALKIGIGLMLMANMVALWIPLLVLMLPFPGLRARFCNVFGKIVGPVTMKLSGCPIRITGREHLDPKRPAIYISNHTSIFDIFIAIWLSPMATVGIAKKEVVYYPFFGQLYLLSANLRIDRGSTKKALKALKKLVRFVHDQKLSIYIWPEGTRSRDGRLLPLRKGFVHLAMQTGLPVVPIVISGAHLGWEKSTLRVRKTPIDIAVLPAIDTSEWSLDTMQQHLDDVWQQFYDHLPDDQRPLSEAA